MLASRGLKQNQDNHQGCRCLACGNDGVFMLALSSWQQTLSSVASRSNGCDRVDVDNLHLRDQWEILFKLSEVQALIEVGDGCKHESLKNRMFTAL